MFSIPGPLCGSCKDDEGYGITMDLNYCVDCSGKSVSGYFLFIAVCKCTVYLALCGADVHMYLLKRLTIRNVIIIITLCNQ